MTEKQAIALCLKHRDPVGFDYLFRQFRREAFYHAYALLANESDAADACQDAFSSAFANMPRLKKLDRFYPWFYRILRNRCLNLLGRKRTRDRYAQARSGDEAFHIDDPKQQLENREASEQVWKQLDQLKSKHREILVLKYIHEFSYDEISETLDIPRGTVMSRLYQARSAFREAYTHE